MRVFEQVEAAWRLCDRTREYSANESCEISVKEMLDKIILVAPEVDLERTRREAKTNPITRVRLNSLDRSDVTFQLGIKQRASLTDWDSWVHVV